MIALARRKSFIRGFCLLGLIILVRIHQDVLAADHAKGGLDLRKIYPSSFSLLPPLDQGKTGTCYAQAASFLIDFKRFFEITQTSILRSDPFILARMASRYAGRVGSEGGNVCDVIRAVDQRGYTCPKGEIEEYQVRDLGIWLHRESVLQVWLPYLNHSEPFIALTPSDLKKGPGAITDLKKKKLFQRLHDFDRKFQAEIVARGLHFSKDWTANRRMRWLQDVFIQNQFSTVSNDLELMFLEAGCEDRKMIVPHLKCQEVKGETSQMVARIYSELFNLKSPRPVGVTLCAEVLAGVGFSKDECSPHAVVVIGYSHLGYLIRNSWGEEDRFIDEQSFRLALQSVQVVW